MCRAKARGVFVLRVAKHVSALQHVVQNSWLLAT